jgi:small-conductance mechanosensitive channel
MRVRRLLFLILVALSLSLLPVACGSDSEETTGPEPTPQVEATAGPEATSLPEGEAEGDVLAEIVVSRTPQPTATPGLIAEEVAEFAYETGLARISFLGLAGDDWINLGISVLLVLSGYALGTWLTQGLLRQVIRRTFPKFGDVLLNAIGPSLRWLIVILALHIATARLVFVSAELKTFLANVYFVLGVVISLLILWRLIDLAHEWYREELAQEGRADELDPVLLLLTRLSHILLAIVGASILLSHFGINITALLAALGIAGLALSLAAQDTLSDAISGFIILADRPYRVGDRIEIQGEGTWGDVVDIGLRTTSVRTRDNRMVIVPNSIIGRNQVVNYTYPDPRYRIQTHLGIGYGTDIATARRIIFETVRQVEGVLPDKPVDVLYHEMGDSAMIFRVRWWIESYEDTRRVIDRVNTALQEALDAAGVEMPYPTHVSNLQVDPETANRLSKAFRAEV